MRYLGICSDRAGNLSRLYEDVGKHYRENPPESKLTILSYGGGQDSTAILYKLFLDPEWKRKYVSGDLLIIMADTGCEHPETYQYVEHIKGFVKSEGGNFIHLKSSMGYHGPTWPDLVSQYKLHSSIGSKAYPKTCTMNLKVVPIYRFVDEYIGKVYLGWDTYKYEPRRQKKAMYELVKQTGAKIRVIIGFAKGEEKRVKTSYDEYGILKAFADPKWMRDTVEKIYPLITEGVDRFGAIKIIESYGHPVPLPSNCMFCPFMNDLELLWLYRFYPEKYKEWVELEATKIEKYKAVTEPGKNFGVFGKKLLPQVLQETIQKYPQITNEELQAHKMTHGHNITTSY